MWVSVQQRTRSRTLSNSLRYVIQVARYEHWSIFHRLNELILSGSIERTRSYASPVRVSRGSLIISCLTLALNALEFAVTLDIGTSSHLLILALMHHLRLGPVIVISHTRTRTHASLVSHALVSPSYPPVSVRKYIIRVIDLLFQSIFFCNIVMSSLICRSWQSYTMRAASTAARSRLRDWRARSSPLKRARRHKRYPLLHIVRFRSSQIPLYALLPLCISTIGSVLYETVRKLHTGTRKLCMKGSGATNIDADIFVCRLTSVGIVWGMLLSKIGIRR